MKNETNLVSNRKVEVFRSEEVNQNCLPCKFSHYPSKQISAN